MLHLQGGECTRTPQHPIRTPSIRVAAASIVTLRPRHAVAAEHNQRDEETTTACSTEVESTLPSLDPHKKGTIHLVVGTGDEHSCGHNFHSTADRPR